MNHTAMKIFGGTIGMLSLVAIALVAVLVTNTAPADAQERTLTESSVELIYLTSSNTGSPGDDGQRVIETTNERIAQGFWVGQGGPNYATNGSGAHKYSIEQIQVEQTWTSRHASTEVEARIYRSLESRPHSQVCTLEYASHRNDDITFRAPDYGCKVYGLEHYFVVISLKDATNNAEIEITEDSTLDYDDWSMDNHFLSSVGGSKTWKSEDNRLRVAIRAKALYEDPPDVGYTRPKFIRATEGQPKTYYAKFASKPRIAWNFRVDTVNSELTSSMVCPRSPAPPPSASCLITPHNWQSPIAITVTPPHDDDGEGTKFLMKHQVFQKAPHNNAENAVWEEDTLRIVVTDDDKYEFVGPKGTVNITEDIGHSIVIRLGAKPTGNFRVTATLTGFEDLLGASSTFSFTGNDWTDGYHYQIAPTDDQVAQERTGSLTVTYAPNPGDEDPAWANIRPLTIPIKIIDDDIPGYDLAGAVGTFTRYYPLVTAPDIYGYQVDVDEDASVRYALKLLTEPLEPVTIRATHWRGVRVIENAEVTYDSTNWNAATPPFFKVKANRFAFDAKDRYAEVRYQVISSGSDYRNLLIQPLRVTIRNIDPN